MLQAFGETEQKETPETAQTKRRGTYKRNLFRNIQSQRGEFQKERYWTEFNQIRKQIHTNQGNSPKNGQQGQDREFGSLRIYGCKPWRLLTY